MGRGKSTDTLYWGPMPLLQGQLTLGGIPAFTWFSTGSPHPVSWLWGSEETECGICLTVSASVPWRPLVSPCRTKVVVWMGLLLCSPRERVGERKEEAGQPGSIRSLQRAAKMRCEETCLA